MRGLKQPKRTVGILSRRAREELSTLQSSVRVLGADRDTALRLFFASRHSTTVFAQREFWLEFSWLDQEYRLAVRRLAQFCLDHKDGSARRLRTA